MTISMPIPFPTDPISAILLTFDKVVSPILIFSLVYVELFAVFDVLAQCTDLSSLEKLKFVIVDLQTAEKC